MAIQDDENPPGVGPVEDHYDNYPLLALEVEEVQEEEEVEVEEPNNLIEIEEEEVVAEEEEEVVVVKVLNPAVNPEMKLFYLIRHFLAEEGYRNTVLKLDIEKSLHLDYGFLEQTVLSGNFDTATQYFLGTNLSSTNVSKVVFEILKQKFLETIDSGDLLYGTSILYNQLNWVQHFDPPMWEVLNSVLRPGYNFRERRELSYYGYDLESMRQRLERNIRKLLAGDDDLTHKMLLPWIGTKGLREIHSDVANRRLLQTSNQELIFLIRQFLVEENCHNTVHMLEREKSIFFDLSHFRDLALTGQWDNVLQYIWPLTEVDNTLLIKILKQDYLEALTRGDIMRVVSLLRFFKDRLEQEDLKKLSVLVAYANIREHPDYHDIDPDLISMRQAFVGQLEAEIIHHLLIKDRLILPWINSKDLRTIYNEHEVKEARRASI